MEHIRTSLADEIPGHVVVRSERPGHDRTTPSLALVLVLSLGAHVVGAGALTLLPTMHGILREAQTHVAVTLTRPAPVPPPEVVAPPPEVVSTPEPIVPSVRRAPTEASPPTPVEPAPDTTPEPPSPVTAAPPSLDDVFGDPPPAPDLLSGSSGGSYTVAAGEGGPPGGRAGGTGTTLGGGAGPTATDGVDDAAARRRARLAYKRELERLLRARTSYPRAALRERLEGRVELALRIGHDGSLLGVRVADSSGFSMLDEAALSSARIDRLPAPPEAAGLRETDELVVGVVYVVR